MAQRKNEPFYGSERAQDLLQALMAMEADDRFDTTTTYTANGDSYPDHRLPFRDKHMSYVSTHPQVVISQYVANLRLVTRKR